jgi:hypothetical protein
MRKKYYCIDCKCEVKRQKKRCSECNKKFRQSCKGSKNGNYKHGKYCTLHYCIKCGKEIDRLGRSKK